MSKGQEHTKYQRGIVQRFYEHKDTIALQRLSEIVSDLYLAEGGQATKLWNNARTALSKLAPADDPHVLKVLSVRSVTGLAKLVTELSAGAKATASETKHASLDAGDVDADPGDLAEPTISGLTTTSLATDRNTIKAPSPSPPVAAPPTSEQLKSAMKAFRKRLKLTRLDEESKLGRTGNPMSSGRKSEVQAIMPPREYPREVWEELVKQGKLKSAGGSFYSLIEGA